MKAMLIIVWLANGMGLTAQGATSIAVPMQDAQLCEKQIPKVLKELGIQAGWVAASCVTTTTE